MKIIEIGAAEANTAYGRAQVCVSAAPGEAIARVTVLGVTQTIHLPADAAERLGNLLRNAATESRVMETEL